MPSVHGKATRRQKSESPSAAPGHALLTINSRITAAEPGSRSHSAHARRVSWPHAEHRKRSPACHRSQKPPQLPPGTRQVSATEPRVRTGTTRRRPGVARPTSPALSPSDRPSRRGPAPPRRASRARSTPGWGWGWTVPSMASSCATCLQVRAAGSARRDRRSPAPPRWSRSDSRGASRRTRSARPRQPTVSGSARPKPPQQGPVPQPAFGGIAMLDFQAVARPPIPRIAVDRLHRDGPAGRSVGHRSRARPANLAELRRQLAGIATVPDRIPLVRVRPGHARPRRAAPAGAGDGGREPRPRDRSDQRRPLPAAAILHRPLSSRASGR